MRIEQRIGRIDRRGQKSDTVKIYNMIIEDTIDAAIYDRCLSKIGVFEASIGDCSEILGDISEQISKIMFDSGLTEEERILKIEKMADNEVMKVQEMQRLEQEEKSLYGFDLTGYIMNKDVQDAENAWISPQSLNGLVNEFLDDYLGEGEYIRGKAELKSLRLAVDKRKLLLENLNKINPQNNNNASKLWKAYLKSDKPVLPITFDGLCAKDNRDAAFFTQMHPLVIQAAQYESEQFPCEIGIQISDDTIPTGDYEFLIYAWKFVGLRPDIKLIALAENIEVQKQVLTFLQYSDEFDFDVNPHIENWDAMDSLHYTRWQESKEKYTQDVKNECDYRMEQLSHSFHQREAIVKAQIQDAEDEKIIRMRRAQLDKLTADYEAQQRQMNETVSKADIHTELLVKGVLHVE